MDGMSSWCPRAMMCGSEWRTVARRGYFRGRRVYVCVEHGDRAQAWGGGRASGGAQRSWPADESSANGQHHRGVVGVSPHSSRAPPSSFMRFVCACVYVSCGATYVRVEFFVPCPFLEP